MQHHWLLISTKLSHMDGVLWTQEPQYYGIIFPTTLNMHHPLMYLNIFLKHFFFNIIFILLPVPCTFYPILVFIFKVLIYFIGVCDDREHYC